MNMQLFIAQPTTTISGGQLHIAASLCTQPDHSFYATDRWIGTVDSYNNCFTQFFAWLFGSSMTVEFGDKKRIVNTESYTKLVCQLTQQEKIEDIRDYCLFQSIKIKKLPDRDCKMRDVVLT